MKIQFTVETTPYPQPRPRVTRRGVFEPRRISNYKKLIGLKGRLAMRDRPLFASPIRIELSIRRNIKADSQRFGDIDNLIKSVLDALNGVCYVDDRLVVSLFVRKQQSDREGVDIFISDEVISFVDR